MKSPGGDSTRCGALHRAQDASLRFGPLGSARERPLAAWRTAGEERAMSGVNAARAAAGPRFKPYPAYKNSGVEWLGKIPAHWDVTRTKFAAGLRSGHTPSRQNEEYWQGCTIPWFGLSDVWQIRDSSTEYVTQTSEKISPLGLANSAAKLLPKGTVMLSRTASVGFSAIMGVDMATTQDF